MPIVTVYGDESSQNAHQYMVLGTIWDGTNCCEQIEEEIKEIRQINKFHKEFHWTEIKGHQINAYKALVDIYINYQGRIKFRSLVVDQTDQSHRFYSQDDELHFYKMYFWLIFRRLRIENRYDIFLDRKTNSVPGRLSDLKNSLNYKFFSNNRFSPLNSDNLVRRVEPRDGSQIGLQIADVFAGAIAYVRNGYYSKAKENNSKNPKVKIVDYIQEALDINLTENHSFPENESFNIWLFERIKQTV